MGSLLSNLLNWESVFSNPIFWLSTAFQLWMLIDAIRQKEWIWVLFLVIGWSFTALFYYFTVYRSSPSSTRGFEFPGAANRRQIKSLKAQIHHLDKAHHHSQLGDVYYKQGKLSQAEACYRASLERDATDLDTLSHFGQCLLRQNRLADAKVYLEKVLAEDPRHDFGFTQMALAETRQALGETTAAITDWRNVLQNNSYARARVQLAELLTAKGDVAEARQQAQETIEDDVHAPAFQRSRDKVWMSRARSLLARI
ncbi:MAG: tetratricopeptide repeat protein [Pedosphaera sp.]|nr:tetratricopeptide repeat protein [Pedosphaera sp.]